MTTLRRIIEVRGKVVDWHERLTGEHNESFVAVVPVAEVEASALDLLSSVPAGDVRAVP